MANGHDNAVINDCKMCEKSEREREGEKGEKRAEKQAQPSRSWQQAGVRNEGELTACEKCEGNEYVVREKM